ncbi:3575_t:CDS:2 [Paraglomus occultum]|uniref:3575_t:CDS:1 n=1 Tax=Paraglomus occultum TaxID=144539 RepID=A0A9N9CAJ3_9GLOM|nr:3575_t:CDS:2 [Paraglomus occultum]
MRPPSQTHKQQRTSGSRAKTKPMLANRELKPSEKPPAKNCTKCKESANYLKMFVKRLGAIEELTVSGSPVELKTVNKNDFAACTLTELRHLLDLTTKLIQAGTNKMSDAVKKPPAMTEPVSKAPDTICLKLEPEEKNGLLTPQPSPTTASLPASPVESDGKRSREEDADHADEKNIQKRVKICISDVITTEPVDISDGLGNSTPSLPRQIQNDQYRHDSGCFMDNDAYTERTRKDSKRCDTNDNDNPTSACLSNTTVESNFAQETTTLKSTN